jgi:hypothetical protein
MKVLDNVTQHHQVKRPHPGQKIFGPSLVEGNAHRPHKGPDAVSVILQLVPRIAQIIAGFTLITHPGKHRSLVTRTRPYVQDSATRRKKMLRNKLGDESMGTHF